MLGATGLEKALSETYMKSQGINGKEIKKLALLASRTGL